MFFTTTSGCREYAGRCAAQHAGIEVVAAADAVADVKLDVAALVEIGGTLGLSDGARRKEGQHKRRDMR